MRPTGLPELRLTVEEAAARAGVSVATMRRWCADGKVQAIRAGKQWLIDPSTLRGRSNRGAQRSGSEARDFDLETAWKHIKATDLSELWVPDVLRHRDTVDDSAEMLATAHMRIASGIFLPPLRIEIPKTTASNRPGAMLDLPDRVAYQAAVDSFSQALDSSISANVYSSRLAQNSKYFFQRSSTAWKRFGDAVRKAIDATPQAWVAQTDITGYFEHINHNVLFRTAISSGHRR